MLEGRNSTHRAPLTRLVAPLVMVALALLASGCGSSAETAGAEGAEPRSGGEVVLGMDQQPQCLNTLLVCGGMAATTMIWSVVFDDMYTIRPDGTYVTRMATEVPSVDNGRVKVADGGMTVSVTLRKGLTWSDGKPLTCDDVRFRWETTMDERWLIGSRLGWDLVEDIQCPTPTEIVWVFSEPYAPFLGLVSAAPLPRHALKGKDFNTYLNDALPVASGPYRFVRWNRSVDVVLERNPRYWNRGKEGKPYIDRLRYVFVPDTNTLKIQLRTGEVDWISPPPDTSLSQELETFPRSEFQVLAGSFWEQLAFNNAKFPTDDPAVRQALSYAVDREQLAKVVLRGQVDVLQSTLLPSVEQFYNPAWEMYSYEPAKVKAILAKAGWKRNGQYYEKNGRPLTVVLKSTAGNALRMKTVQVLQQGWKENGIKAEILLEAPEVFFGQTTVQGAYHIGLWAWSSSPDPTQQSLFSCDQIPTRANDYEGTNNYRYCNQQVTKLLQQADVTPDVDARAKLLREAQRLMAIDAPLLPLFQRPDTVAYGGRLHGIENNPLGGQLWNVDGWWVDA